MSFRRTDPGATMLRVAAPLLTTALALALAPSSALGQGWSLSTQAGRVTYDTGPSDLGISNLIVGLSYSGLERRWLQLSSAVPLAAEDPFWAAGAAGGRLSRRVGALELGVDGAGYGFLQRDRSEPADRPSLPLPGQDVTAPENSGYGVSGELLPLVSTRWRAATLEARAGVSAYHSAFAEESFTRTVGVTDARVTLSPSPISVVAAEVRHLRVGGVSYPFAGASAYVALGDVSLWGSAGRWLTDSVSVTPWALGASVALGPRLNLTTTLRQESFEPLYESLPRRSWSVGASLALSVPPSLARPVPAEYRDGRATIVLDGDAADAAPRVAGDFTEWEPVPMERAGGRWRWTGALEPGVYHFSFVSADGEWFVPADYPGRQDDGMGGHVAVLVVEGT